MGRHRRSAAGRAAGGRATEGTAPGTPPGSGPGTGAPGPSGSGKGGRPARGIAPYLNPEAYAETTARSEAYLYATDDAPSRAAEPGTGTGRASGAGGHRGAGKRVSRPVRTGLLGVSAAVALGAVAVATGVVPGAGKYTLGGDTGNRIEAAETPTGSPSAQGGTSGSAHGRGPGSTGRDDGRAAAPAPSPGSPSAGPGTTPETTPGGAPGKTPGKTPGKSPGKPSGSTPGNPPGSTTGSTPGNPPGKRSPEPKAPGQQAPGTRTPSTTPSKKPGTAPSPSRTATKAPPRPSAPGGVSREAAAAAEVLRLVNVERAKAGCTPVAANSALSGLAQSFSESMAARGFFDHTDPDGATPWDRAEKAGISGLGGENIARGQGDAAAVMDAWMNSAGHRANILNCDFTTLGVGVQFGSGGPWWTQNFGY
ncbi:CAP domain-containing protein [Streptomyces sp. NPDC091377]|uniref:CAP domain-containing protein n=1 Tax=Streptomyces sp. NPDC091377 TaxID=3365995 RepID=UPI00380D7476